MDEQLKRRLIGATVLTSLAVIFLPMLFDGEPIIVENPRHATIPAPPSTDKFQSKLIRNEIPAPVPVDLTVESSEQETDIEVGETSANEPELMPAVTAKVGPVPKLESVPRVEKQTKPAVVRKGLTAWVIQVGSFSSLANADKLTGQLRKAGFDTMKPELVEINGKKLYRVRVGPELKKANASKQLKGVNKVSATKGIVVKYP